MNDSTTRRTMIKSSIALSAAAIAMGSEGLIAAPQPEADSKATPTGKVILFQGDSITDAGRDRNRKMPNDAAALGKGYPVLIAGELLCEHAQSGLQIYNRGISGNKVPDLEHRWDEDCIALKPDVLSILIGVNDIWHKLNGKYDGTVDTYYTGFKTLLERTATALPNTKIVICEPFVLRCGAVNDAWFPEFEQRRAMAERLATERKLDFVPFQKMFDEAIKEAAPTYWAADGVHPTLAGHALMAEKWREVTGM